MFPGKIYICEQKSPINILPNILKRASSMKGEICNLNALFIVQTWVVTDIFEPFLKIVLDIEKRKYTNFHQINSELVLRHTQELSIWKSNHHF